MANLENSEATVDLTLCDPGGDVLATAQVMLAAMGHLAQFVDEFQWDANVDFSNFQGLLKVTASESVAATVIQTRPGEFAGLIATDVALIPLKPVSISCQVSPSSLLRNVFLFLHPKSPLCSRALAVSFSERSGRNRSRRPCQTTQ